MSAETNEVTAAAPDALTTFTTCPEWGQGGQFFYDPATQTRTRVQPQPAPAIADTADTADVAVDQAQDSAPAATTSTSKKERTRG